MSGGGVLPRLWTTFPFFWVDRPAYCNILKKILNELRLSPESGILQKRINLRFTPTRSRISRSALLAARDEIKY